MLSKRVVLLFGIAAIALSIRFLPHPEKSEPSPDSAATPPIERSAVDVTALAERLAAPPPVTPRQIEEDERIDAEQVAHARSWLESPDPAQRIAGAEQLSAYPTPQAERLLVQALAADPEPEVRGAAAQSLENFDEPTVDAVTALLNALEDPSDAVRGSAFSALQSFIAEATEGSVIHRKIVAGLKRKQTSRLVPKEARKFIADFLSDQGHGKR